MIVRWIGSTAKFKPAPHGFEAGHAGHVAGAVGLHAAMDYLDTVGRQNIFEHDRDLAAYAYTRLSELGGVRLFGPGDGPRGAGEFSSWTTYTRTTW